VSAELEALEAALGYQFKNRQLLQRAMTHRSSVYEKAAPYAASADNEQLEFLGDAVLGLVISDRLIARYSAASEGRLSKLKAHLVSAAHLHQVALHLNLGQHLRLGRGEELSGGREKKALLSNAVEAVIAAVYLDGGLEAAGRLVSEHVLDAAPGCEESVPLADYKGALQEMTQALKLPQPRYSIVQERGPEHSKTFLVEVRVGEEWVSSGEGMSKKSAGQKAAQKILQQLKTKAVPLKSGENF
jgi:ribonuclease III